MIYIILIIRSIHSYYIMACDVLKNFLLQLNNYYICSVKINDCVHLIFYQYETFVLIKVIYFIIGNNFYIFYSYFHNFTVLSYYS